MTWYIVGREDKLVATEKPPVVWSDRTAGWFGSAVGTRYAFRIIRGVLEEFRDVYMPNLRIRARTMSEDDVPDLLSRNAHIEMLEKELQAARDERCEWLAVVAQRSGKVKVP